MASTRDVVMCEAAKKLRRQDILNGSTPEPNSGCWLWLGKVDKAGYGRMRFHCDELYAHRVSYEVFKKAIPKHLELDHLCRVRCCVNPDHLEAVAHQENIARGRSHWRDKTHCPKGHPYSGNNLFLDSLGKRRCMTCYEARKVRLREEHKERKERWKANRLRRKLGDLA